MRYMSKGFSPHVVGCDILPIIMRNGTKAIKAIKILTPQSATAKLTQSGTSDPTFRKGTGPCAHMICSAATGLNLLKRLEKAMVKKITVSTMDEMIVETSGAFHQDPTRRRLNTAMSNNCATKNAEADPIATRNATAGPYSSMIWDPINEQIIPTMRPT